MQREILLKYVRIPLFALQPAIEKIGLCFARIVRKPEKVFVYASVILMCVYAFFTTPVTLYFHGVERTLQVADYAMAGLGKPGQIPLGYMELIKDMHPNRLKDIYYGQAQAWDKQLQYRIPYFTSDKPRIDPPKNETIMERYWRWLDIPLQSDTTLPYKTAGEPAFYPIVGFIPYIIPTMIGFVLNLPPLIIVYMASICNSLFCIYLGYWMIRTIPVMKWAYVFLLTFPSLFFIRLVVMPDAICLELCMLMTALIIRLMLQPSFLSYGRQALLLLLAGLVGLVKVAYFPITLLTVLLPPSCFTSEKNRRAFVIAAISTSTLASLMWAMYLHHAYEYKHFTQFVAGKGWGGTYGTLVNPFHTLYSAVWLFFNAGVQEEWLRNMYFWPLWLLVRNPMACMWLGFAAIALTVCAPTEAYRWYPTRRQRGVFLLGFIAVYMTIYIAKTMTTPMGTGLQGRYFEPALPLLLAAMYKPFEIKSEKHTLMIRKITDWAAYGFVFAGIIIWVEMHIIMFRILRII